MLTFWDHVLNLSLWTVAGICAIVAVMMGYTAFDNYRYAQTGHKSGLRWWLWVIFAIATLMLGIFSLALLFTRSDLGLT